MAKTTTAPKKNTARPRDEGVALSSLCEALADALAEVEELEDMLGELKEALADGDAERARQILDDYLDEDGDDGRPKPEED